MRIYRHIATVTLCLIGSTWPVLGDGCFVWDKGADLTEPSQKAIIHWQDGKETLVLQVKYEGPAEDFAWIVPLPARPEIAALSPEKSPFAEISLFTQSRAQVPMDGPDETPALSGEGINVLERRTVGVYDIAVVAGDSGVSLSQWLVKNGYAFPAAKKDVLNHYIKKQWVFACMRIDRKALRTDEISKLKTGELQPIRFSFATKECVYPLRISSVNKGKTELLVYVLSDCPMVPVAIHDAPPFPGFAIDTHDNMPSIMHGWRQQGQDFAYGTWEKVSSLYLPTVWDALALSKDITRFVCKYRAVLQATDMKDDLIFVDFKPVDYWRTHLETAKMDEDRCRSLTILAWHDQKLRERLLHSDDEIDQQALAICPRTSVDTLKKLTQSNYQWARYEIVDNPAATPEILDLLSRDPWEAIRRNVAGHDKTTTKTLETLSNDQDDSVRRHVAGNMRTPMPVLVRLTHDGRPSVADTAKRMLNLRHQQLPGSFEILADALTFIGKCLDEDEYTKLAHTCIGGHKPKGVYLAQHRTPFDMLQAAHQKESLLKRYARQEFPKDADTFKLGGHMSELGCLHVDFVKKNDKWFLADIWNCR